MRALRTGTGRFDLRLCLLSRFWGTAAVRPRPMPKRDRRKAQELQAVGGGACHTRSFCPSCMGRRMAATTLNILDNVDKHPAADLLLLNLVEYAGK